MAFSDRQVRKALKSKLGFEESRSGNHAWFVKWHNGLVVGRTKVSHQPPGRDISDSLISAMARQLGVRGPELRGAISCAIRDAEFLDLLLDHA